MSNKVSGGKISLKWVIRYKDDDKKSNYGKSFDETDHMIFFIEDDSVVQK